MYEDNPAIERDDVLISRLPEFLAHSTCTCWLKASLGGEILAANPAFESLLGETGGGLVGGSLWDRLTEPDAATLQAILRSEGRDFEPRLLNFVARDQSVYSLQCHLEAHRQGFVLVGEPVREHDQALPRELLELNNRWSLLVRENEKNAKALRQANSELREALKNLDESHWHLRKIQETLPICMYCGKVKTADTRWEEVVEYLKANSLFLSHGCCPECLPRLLKGGM